MLSKIKPIDNGRFLQLQAIFSEKMWPIISGTEDRVFEDFCDMLSQLSEPQQDLMLQLTKKFLWITENDYRKLFYLVFNTFVRSITNKEIARIIITPLVAPKDLGKIKSSHALYYLLEPNFNRRNYSQYDISFMSNYKPLLRSFRSGDVVCLIDDFIGTGTQVVEAVEYLESAGVTRENISVLSFIIQNIGYNRCLESKIAVFYEYLRERGISDCSDGIAEQIALMEEIEQIVSPPSGYSFGKGRTEALVKVVRTPNNTFPVFWYTNEDRFPIAPFPRRPR